MSKTTLHKSYYLITLSYIGARYFGWQKQSELKSVHSIFEKSLEKVLNEHTMKEVTFHSLGSSRTDARVNALGQRVKVKLVDFRMDASKLKAELNKALPLDIHVEAIEESTKEFKVIADAKSKEYFYLFTHGKESTPFNYPYITVFEEELDIMAMQEAARLFIGKYDFERFSYRHGSSNTVREVFDCTIVKDYHLDFGALKIITPALVIRGDGFVKQMVRIIMGTLVNVGLGKLSHDDIQSALNLQSDLRPGFIAPPHGLFLKEIKY